MHIIKHECGYINAELIESYGIQEGLNREGMNDWQICAYTPNESMYILGRCMIEENAKKRLDYLAKWLTSGKDGIFDAMHIRESDDDKDGDIDD